VLFLVKSNSELYDKLQECETDFTVYNESAPQSNRNENKHRHSSVLLLLSTLQTRH